MKILIVGFGGIGKRHLEGILNTNLLSEIEIDIDVVEINRENIKAYSKNNFVLPNRNLKHFTKFSTSIPEKENWDVVIVATNANERYDVVMKIKDRCKYLILEKFLFNNPKQYQINFQNNIVYVNCPRRVMPGYIQLKKEYEGRPISLSYYGLEGFLSNAIHFIDLFDFIAEGGREIDFYLESDEGKSLINSDGSIVPIMKRQSKRKGYFDSNSFSITSRSLSDRHYLKLFPTKKNAFLFPEIRINDYYIDEQRRIITHCDGCKISSRPFDFKYQSELTGRYIADILSSGTCGLAFYGRSAYWHLSLLYSLRRIGWTTPIT